jgi:hypothetical protein
MIETYLPGLRSREVLIMDHRAFPVGAGLALMKPEAMFVSWRPSIQMSTSILGESGRRGDGNLASFGRISRLQGVRFVLSPEN